ncbi:protein tyrosine phosphatase type IVA 2-like isoform X1 [Poeciliopsis prolifica]|uniref:protein tyrosine phosphatase type IVA 2-like isoform X1 n=1 Tax=Poeciliopsis prolifica TaxID=188132 RepID=UPI002412F711|nr:protein tyrosine phosphatase type IVA 2-like isoform X1 [Poeciliopsis prolifica]
MNRPAPVEISYDCLRFLITHNPTDAQLGKFIEVLTRPILFLVLVSVLTRSVLLQELKAYGVTTLVRVCSATYDRAPLGQEGIQVLDWPFDDGSAPPEQVVDDWLNLLQVKFREEPGGCVAVHCVAGLGRAPVLVALALIECGMEYEDAVHLIRQKRRGALNAKQLHFLENYRPKLCLRSKDANGQSCCLQ